MINIITNTLIKENIISVEDSEIYKYGIFVLLFNLSSILSIILLSVFFDSLPFTLLFLCFFIPIRIIIGGFHCKSAKNCFISFIITYLVILLLSKTLHDIKFCLILGLISMLLITILHINSNKHIVFKILLILISGATCAIILTNSLFSVPFMYANLLNIILYLVPIISNHINKYYK